MKWCHLPRWGKLTNEHVGRWESHFGNLWFGVLMKHPGREGDCVLYESVDQRYSFHREKKIVNHWNIKLVGKG